MAGKLISKLFGGINANSTALNIGDTEAASIVNWDIGRDGAITRRNGSALLATLGTPMCHIGKFNATNGSEVFVAVANAKVWRSTDATTWTDVTGSVSITATSGFVGCAYKNKYFVCNGTDAPFYVASTGDAATVESDSILDPPPPPVATRVGVAASAYNVLYCVTAVTPRGETYASGVSADVGAPNTGGHIDWSPTNYGLVSWVPVPGASRHRIYCCKPAGGDQSRVNGFIAQGAWGLVGEVDGTTAVYQDSDPNFILNASNLPIYVPTVNTAYLTPNDWNLNGQPYGMIPIARGRDERMLAWRGDTIWASGLADPFNWLTPNDAFIWTVQGGRDNRISGIGNLFDYTLVFTRTDAFLYSGASAGTISLEKVVPTGCASHNSIVPAGDDLYFWSQYGPTSMQRIVSGADIKNTTNFNDKIQPLFFATAQGQWDKICAYTMPIGNRVVYWVPGAGQTSNTVGYVYQYDIGAWTSYDTWTPVSVVVAATGEVYAGFSDGKVYQLHTGYTDNNSAITAVYTTGNMDLNNWEPRKRIPWVDVVADRTSGNYQFSVEWNFDMGRQSAGPVQCTANTTDGNQVTYTSSTTTQHRVFTTGIGNTIQLVFTADSVGQNVKIIGYGTEARPLGKR